MKASQLNERQLGLQNATRVDTEFSAVLRPRPAGSVTRAVRSRSLLMDSKQELFESIRRVNSEREIVPLMSLLATEAKKLLAADLVSVFLFDPEKCELSSLVSLDKQRICFDARLGVAGAAALRQQTINVRNAYEDPLFYKEIDAQTGYRTRTILAVPIKNARGVVVGVCEAINKKDGAFTEGDAEILEAFAAHAGNAIETALLIDALKKEPRSATPDENRIDIGQLHLRSLVGTSPQIQSIVRLIDQLRESSVDVLIEGESGTGKELVARALHYNSPRYQKPLVALNCAALPDNLVETELFGVEKGVATGVEKRIGKFELANGSTLFLDEIGDLSLSAQAKILRAIQERAVDRVGGSKSIAVDVRIIAATNKNLDRAIKEGTFREDLYYRLRVVRIQTPPLREIACDIPLMANHFLAKHCTLDHKQPKQFSPEAMELLKHYSWAGNARELENEVKRLLASIRENRITEDHLNLPSHFDSLLDEQVEESFEGKTLGEVVESVERRMIKHALNKHGWNKQKAAHELGLSRQGLAKKLKRLDLV